MKPGRLPYLITKMLNPPAGCDPAVVQGVPMQPPPITATTTSPEVQMNRSRSAKASRALEIRDHVWPLMRKRGVLVRFGPGSLLTWDSHPFKFSLATPFSRFPIYPATAIYDDAVYDDAVFKDASSPQSVAKSLPYKLNVWRGSNVMLLEWADDGHFELVILKSGGWENEALALV